MLFVSHVVVLEYNTIIEIVEIFVLSAAIKV